MMHRCTTIRKAIAHELDCTRLLVNATGLPQALKDSIGQRLMRIFAEAERLSAPPTEQERKELNEMFELVNNAKETI